MLQRQDLAAAISVQQVLEAPELFHLMECLLQVCCALQGPTDSLNSSLALRTIIGQKLLFESAIHASALT